MFLKIKNVDKIKKTLKCFYIYGNNNNNNAIIDAEMQFKMPLKHTVNEMTLDASPITVAIVEKFTKFFHCKISEGAFRVQ